MTIFVSIACYRDPELVPTLRDLFAKAARPDDLRVCVCDQFGPETATWPDDLAGHRGIERITIPWNESRGACWARALIQSRYRGEDFYLQLDSHHRFVDGWDEVLMAELAATNRTKALLTGYVHGYIPGEPLDASQPALDLQFDAFHPDGIVVFRPVMVDERRGQGRPFNGRFISGHFIFAPGSFVVEVPYDAGLYFIGEEISLSVRAFMAGWYIFHPSRVIVWHEYTRKYRENKHWTDHRDGAVAQPWWERDRQSRRSVAELLHNHDHGESVRTLKQYEDYAGVCFSRQRVHPYTLEGGEPPSKVESGWQEQGERYVFSIEIPAEVADEAQQVDFWQLRVVDEQNRLLLRREVYAADLGAFRRTPRALVVPLALDAASAPAFWTFLPYSATTDQLTSVEGEIHVGPSEPRAVFVTALLDLGRDALAKPRPYSEYRARFAELLSVALRDCEVVVYCAADDEEFVRSCRGTSPTRVVRFTLDDLAATPEFGRIEELRQREEWRRQAVWLPQSPQAELRGYAALVMFKFDLIEREASAMAAHERVFWVDAGLTRTVRPESIVGLGASCRDDSLRLFAYPYPVETAEIHGFSRSGLEAFAPLPVEKVVRGGFFGGRVSCVLDAAPVYRELRRETLAAGELGTEESLFSILHARGATGFGSAVVIDPDGLIPSQPFGRAPWSRALPTMPDRLEYAAAAREIRALDRRNAPAHIRIDGPDARPQLALVAPWMDVGDIATLVPGNGQPAAAMAFVSAADLARAEAEFAVLHDLGVGRRYLKVTPARPAPVENAGARMAVYVLSFNAPHQFEAWLENTSRTCPELHRAHRRVLVNNSTDAGVAAAYDELCVRFGFEQLRFDNIGITGGRIAASRHFVEHAAADQMWYFEDDMFVCDSGGVCRNGFPRSVENLVEVVTSIVANEAELDGLKLSFTEYFGCHQLDWAWVNSSTEARAAEFEQGSATMFRAIRSTRGVAWALGDVHYSHWPMVLTRRGATRMFGDAELPSDERGMMLRAHALQRSGALRLGVLLASPVEHTRVEAYDGHQRRES